MGKRSKRLLIRMACGTTAGGKGSGSDGGRAWLSQTGTGVVRAARPVRGVPPQVPRPRRGHDGQPAPHPRRRQPPTGMCRATRGPPRPPLRGGPGARRGPTSPSPAVAPPPPHPIAPPPPPLAATRRHRAAPHPSHPAPTARRVSNSAIATGARRAGWSPPDLAPLHPAAGRVRLRPRTPPTRFLSPPPTFPARSHQCQQHLRVPSPGWKPAASATAVGRRQAGAHHGDGRGVNGGREVRGRGRKEPGPSGAAGRLRRGRRRGTGRRRGGRSQRRQRRRRAHGRGACGGDGSARRAAGMGGPRGDDRRAPLAVAAAAAGGGRGGGSLWSSHVWRAHGQVRDTAAKNSG